MKQHLKEAIKKYNREDNNKLIHPISEIDGQIITEILELFKKMNFIAAIDIVDKWKMQSDDDTALALLDLNTIIAREQGDNPEQGDKVVKTPPIPDRFVLALGRRLDMWYVLTYDCIDYIVGEEIKYCIKLNPTPENVKQVPMYSNELLIFKNEEDREEILEIMDSWMETHRGKFIG